MEQIDPIRLFEVAQQVSTITPGFITGTIATNITIVSGVTDKRIRVMGWEAQNVGSATANLVFRKANAGSPATQKYYLAPLDIIDKPITNSGYFETASTGQDLVCDIAGDLINLTVYYITYTPAA